MELIRKSEERLCIILPNAFFFSNGKAVSIPLFQLVEWAYGWFWAIHKF